MGTRCGGEQVWREKETALELLWEVAEEGGPRQLGADRTSTYGSPSIPRG